MAKARASLLRWTNLVPLLAAIALVATLGRDTVFAAVMITSNGIVGLSLVLAVASIWLAPPLELGLGPTELMLLAITFVTGALTAPLGQATVQQSGVRLVLFAAFLVLAVFP